MMVVLRAFALVAVGIGAGALHHVMGKEISLGIGDNDPAPVGSGEAGEGDPEVNPTAAQVTGDPDDPAADTLDPEAAAPNDPPAETPAETLTYDDLEVEVDIDGAAIIFEMMLVGDAAIIDARSPENFAAGRILGAFNITQAMFRDGVPEDVQFMDKAAPVMIYCQGGSCTDSIAVGQALRDLGFQRLHVFEDGYPAWVEAGFEIEEGGL